MSRIRRFIAVIIAAAAALLLASPLALYWLGLSGVDVLPQKPSQLASTEQQALVWKRARGDGIPHIAAENPYSYLVSVLVAREHHTPPSQLLTWWVASDYLMKHKRHQGTGWWHLSGAALTIWLSRHWTSEEILSAAVRSRRPTWADKQSRQREKVRILAHIGMGE